MGKGIGTDSTISSMGTGALSLGHDKIVSTVPAECFLLKDDFIGNYGAPLVSPRMCMPGPGQLILDQTDGQFSIVGNEFTWPAQGTPVWGDQGWVALKPDGDEYDMFLAGQVLKFRGRWTDYEGSVSAWFGYSRFANVAAPAATCEHGFYRAVVVPSFLRCPSGNQDLALDLRDLWPGLDDYFQAAICARAYSSTGLHWYPEAVGVYAHGAHFFYRDEAGADSWRLAWYRQLQSRTDPIWPAFANYDSQGRFDYVRIPCDGFRDELLAPIAWDEFADNNGVLLPNHTITYGLGLAWVSAVGVWQITGNQADPDNTANAYCYVPTLAPDVWIEVDADYSATGVQVLGIAARASANTSSGANFWSLRTRDGVAGVDTRMSSYEDGVGTVRASADIDPSAAVHNVRVRCDDEQLTLYIDYVEVLHYATAWFNKHATWHGLVAYISDDGRFDNFIILPRGTGLERVCYDDFTHANGTSLDATVTEEGALAWVECVGDWDIQGNEANPDGTADAHAHIVTTVSDVWVCARELNQAAYGGVLMRGSTATDYWYYAIRDATGTDSKLVEVDSGVQTVRSSTDTDAFAVGTRYYLEVSCEGQDINCYTDGTLRETFGTASFNETAVWHGLYANNAIRHDQFRVTEIPALGEYDEALDSF